MATGIHGEDSYGRNGARGYGMSTLPDGAGLRLPWHRLVSDHQKKRRPPRLAGVGELELLGEFPALCMVLRRHVGDARRKVERSHDLIDLDGEGMPETERRQRRRKSSESMGCPPATQTPAS